MERADYLHGDVQYKHFNELLNPHLYLFKFNEQKQFSGIF